MEKKSQNQGWMPSFSKNFQIFTVWTHNPETVPFWLLNSQKQPQIPQSLQTPIRDIINSIVYIYHPLLYMLPQVFFFFISNQSPNYFPFYAFKTTRCISLGGTSANVSVIDEGREQHTEAGEDGEWGQGVLSLSKQWLISTVEQSTLALGGITTTSDLK